MKPILSERECELLAALANGTPEPRLAARLGTCTRTVEYAIRRLNRLARPQSLVEWAVGEGWIVEGSDRMYEPNP